MRQKWVFSGYSGEVNKEESDYLLSQSIYLPIGSVVSIEGSTNKILIIGVLQSDMDNPTKIYDYSGVSYPIGLLSPDKNWLFDKSQIDTIDFFGYWGSDQDVLQERIKNATAQQTE